MVAGVELQLQSSSSFEDWTSGSDDVVATAFSRQAVVLSGQKRHQNYDSKRQKEHPADLPHFSLSLE